MVFHRYRAFLHFLRFVCAFRQLVFLKNIGFIRFSLFFCICFAFFAFPPQKINGKIVTPANFLHEITSWALPNQEHFDLIMIFQFEEMD